jgi:hypothetical protein
LHTKERDSEMTTNDLCDDILKLCVTKIQLTPNFTLQQLYAAKGVQPSEVEGVLRYLSNNPPAYLQKLGDNYVLTPAGEEFIKAGGYAGQKQRESTEQIINQQDRELTKLVNKSVLDTNNSVLQTHGFQRRTTWITLMVAISSVVIAAIGLFKDNGSPKVEPLVRQQLQMQRQIDSLQNLLKSQSCPDTLQQKHPK